jgi:hypothetical protein
MQSSQKISLKLRMSNMSTCPICYKPITPEGLCKALSNNHGIIGYAHEKCFSIVSQAMEIIRDKEEA